MEVDKWCEEREMRLTKTDILKWPYVNSSDHGVILGEMFLSADEEWRQAISKYGVEPRLLVSSKGRIVGLPYKHRPCSGTAWKMKYLRGNPQTYGHTSVSWSNNEGTPDAAGRLPIKRDFIHQIVARTFIGPPSLGNTHVRHRNGNPRDNCVINLVWGNRDSNMRDRLSDPDSYSVMPNGLFIGAALQRRIAAAIDGDLNPIDVLKEIRTKIGNRRIDRNSAV